MKILFVSSSSGSLGGGEIYLLKMAQALKGLNHEVLLWVSNHSKMDALAEQFSEYGEVQRYDYTNTYDYRLRSLRHKFHSKSYLKKIAGTWDTANADIIHINKQNLEDGLDLVQAVEFTTTPCVITIHMTQTAKYLNASQASIRDSLAYKALKKYQGKLITIAESRYKDLREFLGGSHIIKNIDNGVSIPSIEDIEVNKRDLREKLNIDDNYKLVVSVGRLNKQKRPELFFELASEVCKSRSDVKFIWVGEGELRAGCEEIITKNRLQDYISITGWVSNVDEYLSATDLYFHTAAYEGLAFALLEAMAYNCTCIVYEDLFNDLPFNSEEILVYKNLQQFQGFLDEIPHGVARSARNKIIESYSLESMANRYLELYEEVTGAGQ